MAIAPGQHPAISARRFCKNCKTTTDQICHMIRTLKSERSSDYYAKTQWWSCQTCGQNEDVIQEIPEPTEETMLIRRLLRLGKDYDVESFHLAVEGYEVTVKVRLWPFDTGNIRRIIFKAEDTGYITAHDLM